VLKIMACAVAAAGLVGLAACEDDSAEKAGEEIDTALEKAADGKVDRSDGPFEKAGEAIDKATNSQNTDAADSLSDATDGNRQTKPN
jgi:hypothetical protein